MYQESLEPQGPCILPQLIVFVGVWKFLHWLCRKEYRKYSFLTSSSEILLIFPTWMITAADMSLQIHSLENGDISLNAIFPIKGSIRGKEHVHIESLLTRFHWKKYHLGAPELCCVEPRPAGWLVNINQTVSWSEEVDYIWLLGNGTYLLSWWTWGALGYYWCNCVELNNEVSATQEAIKHMWCVRVCVWQRERQRD